MYLSMYSCTRVRIYSCTRVHTLMYSSTCSCTGVRTHVLEYILMYSSTYSYIYSSTYSCSRARTPVLEYLLMFSSTYSTKQMQLKVHSHAARKPNASADNSTRERSYECSRAHASARVRAIFVTSMANSWWVFCKYCLLLSCFFIVFCLHRCCISCKSAHFC